MEVIEERDNANLPLRRYVCGRGIDQPVLMEDAGNLETYYYHCNALGSVSLLTDNTGLVVERYENDTYGTSTAFDFNFANPGPESLFGNPYRFTSRHFDGESGLYYYRARHYHPTQGRFLQRDPIGYNDPVGLLNLYSYCGNNPTNRIDPLGYSSEGDWWHNAGTASHVTIAFDIASKCGSITDVAHFGGSCKCLAEELVKLENSPLIKTRAGHLALQTLSNIYNNNCDKATIRQIKLSLIQEANQIAEEMRILEENKAAGEFVVYSLSVLVAGDIASKVLFPATGAATAGTVASGTAPQIVFKTAHAAGHLAGTNLTSAAVESAIASQVSSAASLASTTGAFWGRVVVSGFTLEYRAYTLAGGIINVGTYYVVK